MSWEANTWACRQRMKLPQEQLVLIVLGNCADPDGAAFVKWPGRDHWWHYLARLTRLSKSSLFRHINTLVALGLCSRSMIVNADGSRRPTISLDLDATFDIEKEKTRYEAAVHSHQRDQSHGETDNQESGEECEKDANINELQEEMRSTELQSHHETSPTSGNESVPIVGTHIDSSIPCSKESPPTPRTGGAPAIDEIWEEFLKTWREPMTRPSLVRSVWDGIPTAKRGEAVTAARGYFVWLGKQAKPPSTVSAQTFLRETTGWSQWLPWAGNPGSTASAFLAYPPGSIEAKALMLLADIAGVAEFFRSVHRRGNGTISYPKPVTLRLAALAEAGPEPEWVSLTRQQAAAWEGFLRETVIVQVRKHLKEGDRAPWPWPPSAEGKIYATGPPDTLMTEQDMADFK